LVAVNIVGDANMSSKHFNNLLVLSFLIFLTCCKNDGIKENASDESNMFDANEQSIQLSQEQIKELTDRVKTLKLGENRVSILKIMGPPDRGEKFIPKRGGVIEWTCTELTYYLTFDAKRPGTDKNIHLMFDRQDKFIGVITHIEELNRGDLEPCR